MIAYLKSAAGRSLRHLGRSLRGMRRRWRTILLDGRKIERVNLGCGPVLVPGYFNIDFTGRPDYRLDLSRDDLPIRDGSLDAVICISAINYFSYSRAGELIREAHRVLRPGGVARFGVQDLELLAHKYVEKDAAFFFQKLPNGADRIEGRTLGDKFVSYFYGYAIHGHPCRYVYDYESLANLFRAAGFATIERRAYRDSRLAGIEQIDNRPDQMFFLEAVR